jgi:hypothetical protein
MTDEITNRQTTDERTGAVSAGQPAPTGSARCVAESATCIEITLERFKVLAREKAPIVGIPRPGYRPLALSRRILAGLRTGVTACRITLTNELEIHCEGRHYRRKRPVLAVWTA